MDFLYQQIGLDDDRLKHVANNLADTILNELHGYGDNHPVGIDLDPEEDPYLTIVIKLLKKHKIILYTYINNEHAHGYSIAVLNRYKLELLRAELVWLERPEQERNDNTAPFADYVVYYDIKTGEMLFNGTYKVLKGRNKALFDVLFSNSPDYVDRKKLLTAIGQRKKYHSSKILINEAFRNLRGVCGVKRHIIQLSSEHGGRLRHIETHPLSAQIPPSRFLTD